MRPRGFTSDELVVLVVVVFALLVLAGMILPALYRAREPGPHRPKCKSNLMVLALGMARYVNEYGDNAWYPCPLGRGRRPDDYNGAEWLASLYWTRAVPDPWVFLCPSSPDGNDGGRDIGKDRAAPTFGSQTVSYAGLHYYSLTDAAGKPKPGAIPASFPPDAAITPMASDDTQGGINHGTREYGGMNVLFFDAHVEFKTNTEIDLENGVGQEGGLLWRLRN